MSRWEANLESRRLRLGKNREACCRIFDPFDRAPFDSDPFDRAQGKHDLRQGKQTGKSDVPNSEFSQELCLVACHNALSGLSR